MWTKDRITDHLTSVSHFYTAYLLTGRYKKRNSLTLYIVFIVFQVQIRPPYH